MTETFICLVWPTKLRLFLTCQKKSKNYEAQTLYSVQSINQPTVEIPNTKPHIILK